MLIKVSIRNKYKRKISRFINSIIFLVTAYFGRKNLSENRLACICDELTYAGLRKQVKDCVEMPFFFWKHFLCFYKPKLLLIESCWAGNNGQWRLVNDPYDRSSFLKLKKITSYCKKNGVKIVFFNKEDPVHYERFREVAAFADYVFTTDSNSVSKYETELGNTNVYTIFFPFQPEHYNPIRASDKCLGDFVFAGSWSAHHKKRCERMSMLLDAMSKYQLNIYDRNSDKSNPSNFYPKKYQRFIRKSVSQEQLGEIYKRHKICLNVNTVEESETMLSRRAIEIMATASAMLSTPSRALELNFSNECVIAEDAKDAEKLGSELINDERARRALAHNAYIKVMRSYTYEDWLAAISDKSGLGFFNGVRYSVTCLAFVSDASGADKAIENFEKQSCREKSLVIIKPTVIDEDFSHYSKENIVVTTVREFSLEQGDSALLACLDTGCNYSSEYLENMLLTTRFCAATAFGKASFNEDFSKEHRWVDNVHPGTLFFKPSLIDFSSILGNLDEYAASNDWQEWCLSHIYSSVLRSLTQSGFSGKFYSTDAFDFTA